MGTKRPSCTLFDTLSNINMPDRKLQPGGKISRDPSPRPVMTTQPVRDREEDRRREKEVRDKVRYKDTDPRERPYDRSPAPRMREGDRERRGQADDRGRNGRPVSNLDKGTEREEERGARKGDTFPRIRKHSPERDRRMMSPTVVHEEKEDSRQRDRPRRPEKDDWEREKAKTWQRDQNRERVRDEGRKDGRRPVEDEKARQRERYTGKMTDAGFQDRGREGGDSWDRRERDMARKREKPRPNGGEREVRWSSPHRRRDRDAYRKEEGREREGKRDIRSEGDSDEREFRRERVRDREREELIYQHSKSEGDDKGKRQREKDPHRQGEDDRLKDRDREREGDRPRQRAGEKDRRGPPEDERRRDDRVRRDDRTDDERYRQMREKERKDRDSRWDDTAGRRRGEMTAPRVPPRSQSSGEWSSDMDRRGRDSNEERETGRESERDSEEARAAERGQERGETQGRERGETVGVLPEQRRMWLEPQRGKEGRDALKGKERDTRWRERSAEEERYEGSQVELEREMQQVKEEPDGQQSRDGERQKFGREEKEEEAGVSVDEEEVWRETDKGGKEYLSDSSGGTERDWRRDAEGESTTDNTEESDREEGEGRSDYSEKQEGGGGSESGRRAEGDSMLSGEDGFVTVSSGGDDGEDEREEDEDEEFEDCQEFWGGGGERGGTSPSTCSKGREGGKDRAGERTMGREEVDEEDQGREKKSKFVFCVVGQTLPRTNPGDRSSTSQVDSGGVGSDEPTMERFRHRSDDGHLTMSRMRGSPITSDQSPEAQRAAVGVKLRSASLPPDAGEAAQGMRSIEENPYDEIGGIKRDSQTEKLLMAWREKIGAGIETGPEQLSPTNPYGDVFPQTSFEQFQPILEELTAGAMSPEDVEAIRIRLSGAWSMSEDPKRHSQAPHLKWAKNVISEILGQSQDEGGASVGKMTTNEQQLEPELEEALQMEEMRGRGQRQADMHAADHSTAMHGDGDTPTHTHDDTQLDRKEEDRVDKEAEPSAPLQLEKAEIEVRITEVGGEEVTLSEAEMEKRREQEVEMYLSVSNTLYKPNSCPILNYESDPGIPVPSREGESQEEDEEREGDSEEEEEEEERQGGEPGETRAGGQNEVDSRKGQVGEEAETKVGARRRSTCSFRDLGPEARIRRRGIRKTTQRRKERLVDVDEEEGVGRDRRTRIFTSTDDDDDKSKSWGEVELRNVLDTIDRRKRNSRFFNAAQLYQQYSEAAQNFEILRQARSDVVSVCEDSPAYSPAPSPPPARRPLPPLPPVPHPHSLSHVGSLTSVKSLPIPERPRSQPRASSARLSTSLTQTATLWRDLPGVRSSGELDDLSEDQRRLQEVRFEVVTSEASYCRSLDIVVEHFVKSKQLGALLATQDRNWLFSRLADVRAISHSFLSKLEERVETDIVHFTVCDIIARHCQRFKMVYVPYLTNQSYQDATYQRLMNENQGFRRIVEKLERSPVCQRLPLRSFLVLPFQRITRIKLLVQNIVKRTTPGTAEATHAIKAMRLLEKLIQESNDSITQMKSIESLVTLSAKVDFECRTLPLISQSRRLVREGSVTELMDFSLKDTERNIYMHLFNDYLLLSLQKEGGRFTVIDHSPVAELRAENCRVKLHSLQKNLFRLHMSTKALLLRTDTQSDKLRWISALSRPHPEIDFSAAQDFVQMQCIRAFMGQQPDELPLEKADIILVHQQSSDHWVEGTRLSDRHRGWVPESHLETITNSRVRQRNLLDAIKLTTATAAV